MNRTTALDVIRQAEIFGVAASTPTTETIAPVETRLDLNLVATFTHTDPALAMALIAEQGMEPLRYRIGDAVGGDGELIEIRSGAVILKRNDRHEVLNLRLLTGDTNH